MMEVESRKFNPRVLTALRSQMGYSAPEVSHLVKIPLDRYLELEKPGAQPKAAELRELAKFFRVREFNFLRDSVPSKIKKVNFRSDLRSYRGEPGPILDAIEFSSSIQQLLVTVSDTKSLWRSRNKSVSLSSDPENEGHKWRLELNVEDSVQESVKEARHFFTYIRSLIEGRGISVVTSSYEEKSLKGLVIGSYSAVPVILINTYMQQGSSRTFTLVHEFCHVLLGKDAVSNPYEADSRIERFCNRFAASFLIPRELLVDLLNRSGRSPIANATIRWLSNKLKVSQEAIVIRLAECGFAPSNFWSVWKGQFAKSGRLPSEEASGGGGAGSEGVDQGLVKLAFFGFLFGLTVPENYRSRGLTSMAVYKASRLKPAYFSDLARAARERLSEVQSYGRA